MKRRTENAKRAHHPSVEELERVLLEEIELYEKYSRELEQDSDRMIQFKVEELEASNKAKATLLLKIQTLEEMRQRSIKKIADEKGISSEGVRVTDLCKTLEPQDGQRLLDLRRRFKEILERIQRTQDSTFAIAKSSMRWIDGSMNQLRNLLNPSGTYNARGRVDHPGSYAGHVVENKV